MNSHENKPKQLSWQGVCDNYPCCVPKILFPSALSYGLNITGKISDIICMENLEDQGIWGKEYIEADWENQSF